jgi:hypothetical protein
LWRAWPGEKSPSAGARRFGDEARGQCKKEDAPGKRVLARKTWAMNPATRVKESSKEYSREKAKKNFRNELDES